ncbi:unnamed protein product [Closterium sp. NIES-54]
MSAIELVQGPAFSDYGSSLSADGGKDSLRATDSTSSAGSASPHPLQHSQDRFLDMGAGRHGFKGASFSSAVFNLVTTVVGAGIMGLPGTMRVLGIPLGIIALVAMGILTQVSLELLIKTTTVQQVWSYGDLVLQECGPKWRLVLDISVLINNFGLCVVYLIIIADVLAGTWSSIGSAHPGLLKEWNGGEAAWWNTRFFVLVIVTLVVLIPLASFRHVDSLHYTSAIAVILAVVFVVITLIITIIKLVEGTLPSPRWLPFVNAPNFFAALCSVFPVRSPALPSPALPSNSLPSLFFPSLSPSFPSLLCPFPPSSSFPSLPFPPLPFPSIPFLPTPSSLLSLPASPRASLCAAQIYLSWPLLTSATSTVSTAISRYHTRYHLHQVPPSPGATHTRCHSHQVPPSLSPFHCPFLCLPLPPPLLLHHRSFCPPASPSTRSPRSAPSSLPSSFPLPPPSAPPSAPSPCPCSLYPCLICPFLPTPVHPIYVELKDRTEQNMTAVTRFSMATCFAIYTLTSLCGYLLFGDATAPDVLANFSTPILTGQQWLNDVVRISYALHVVLVFPVIYYSLRNVTDDLFCYNAEKSLAEDDRRFWIITGVQLVGICIIGTLVPNIWVAFDLTGATSTMIIGMVFPAVIALRDRSGVVHGWERKTSWAMIVWAAIICVTSIGSSIYMLVVGIASQPGSQNNQG